jgi:hypothetical protein
LDRETFKATLVYVAGSGCAVGFVPSLGVGDGDPSHELCQVAVGFGPEDEVEVVAHDAIAAKSHGETVDAFGEDLLEGEKISFLLEYTQATIGTVECVINDVAFRYSLWPGHRIIIA